MRILINLSTLKKGGGQNVALNFLYSLESLAVDNKDFYFFVAEKSAAHEYFLGKKNQNYSVLPSNPIKRILFEIFSSKKILNNNKIDIIYTYFGIGLFTKKIPQISGSADSNLYFPEINFWSHYKGIARLKKWIIDSYRIWGLKRADAVVFENKIMEDRSKELFGLKETTFIMPSINMDVESKELEVLKRNNINKGLFLCGWQLNKNIMLIPEIALRFKELNIPFEFVITAPLDNSSEQIEFLEKVKCYDVLEYIKIIGPVNKEELASLYEKIDFVFLLSKLESFSNNIIEAWHFEKPLIISDELWAHSICKDAAIYVDRNSVNDIVDKLIMVDQDEVYRLNVLSKGKHNLSYYPSINEKTKEELKYLKYVYENN